MTSTPSTDAPGAPSLVQDAQTLYRNAKEQDALRRAYQRSPYIFIGAAAGLGYIAGGGLATPFTRRLLKVGMKALFVPIAAAQLRELALGAGLQSEEIL